ncbi:MAG: polysaccharide pyruvyl transferase family protein [Burkholderiales bacterium]
MTGSRDARSSGTQGAPLRVVLGGWYGAANLGDELLLEVISGWIREGGAVPVAISTHPPWTQASIGVEAVGFGDLPGIVEAMADADLFVLGGGGLFQDYNEFDLASLTRFPCWNVSQYAQFLFLADEMGLPTLALAQGVGPLRGPEGREIAADVFTRALDVSVRDRDSAHLLREIGVQRDVTVAPDPAWSWQRTATGLPPLRERYPALAGRPVLAMILRDWPFDPDWEAQCAAVLREAIPQGWGVLWLDFHRPPDAASTGFSEIARRMTHRLADTRVHVVWDGATVGEAAELLAQCDACVAMRLHGVVLAILNGLPVVSIEYDGKVATLGRDLALPPAQCVGLGDIGTRLAGAIARVTSRVPGSVVLASVVAELRTGALAHRDLLLRKLAHARRERERDVAQHERLLGQWLEAMPAAAPRVVAALTRRLRRMNAREA